MEGPYLDRLFDAVPVSPDARIFPTAWVAIYAKSPGSVVYGLGGWITGHVSSLGHYANHGMTAAFRIKSDLGIVGDRTGLLHSLKSALADLAVAIARHKNAQ